MRGHVVVNLVANKSDSTVYWTRTNFANMQYNTDELHETTLGIFYAVLKQLVCDFHSVIMHHDARTSVERVRVAAINRKGPRVDELGTLGRSTNCGGPLRSKPTRLLEAAGKHVASFGRHQTVFTFYTHYLYQLCL